MKKLKASEVIEDCEKRAYRAAVGGICFCGHGKKVHGRDGICDAELYRNRRCACEEFKNLKSKKEMP